MRTRRWIWHGIPLVLWSLTLVSAAAFMPGPIGALTEEYESDLDAPLSDRALGHFTFVKAHLAAPFGGYGVLDTMVRPFQVVLLSSLAAGLCNVAHADPNRRDEVGPLLGEVIRRALTRGVSPFDRDPRHVDDWGDHNLYVSHLGLILGCHRLVTGDDSFDDLHGRIFDHLAARTDEASKCHARSFPESPRFPADQAVVLLALHLRDRCLGTNAARPRIEAWLGFMRGAATTPDGLHRSCLDDDYPGAEVARGCAMSWTCLHVAQFASAEAATLYARYARRYYDDVGGCGGFREWPRDHDGHVDFDTGPIVFGIGCAASGFGLGAARLHGDREAYAGILRSAATVGFPRWWGTGNTYLFAPMLGEAILFHGLTARHWFEAEPPRDGAASGGWWAPATLLLLAGAIAVLAAWRVYRNTSAWRAWAPTQHGAH